jgi:radical SAM superfamily enzyme YgiQ (UPF0313 family)
MKTLLVYPEFPISYWGFQHTMELVGCKASLPPLGLLTVAALLPQDWELRLVDLNVAPLSDDAIRWADLVLISGMHVQASSMHEVLARARRLGRRTVVGGPGPTTTPEAFADAEIIFVGEAEGRIDELLAALQPGSDPAAPQTAPLRAMGRLLAPQRDRPALDDAPVPRFDLLDIEAYTSMSVQFSRGCPFSCEFCDVIEIFGRKPRLKRPRQVLAELDALYAAGFRRSVFFVDDNFIGNRGAVRRLLPRIARWQRERGFPFELYTEASVDLARDDALMRQMVEAGFATVFVGIETPSTAALRGAGKLQNLALDLGQAVDRMTRAGLEVMGGFIVGFDQDDQRAFEAQRSFIQASAIPLAMVGLLTALPGTVLCKRLQAEGRLRGSADGDAFTRPNFVPVMDEEVMLREYRRLLADLYSPEAYYRRCQRYVDRAAKLPGGKRAAWHHIATLLRTTLEVGIRRPGSRRHYWKLVARTLLRARHHIAWTIGHAAMGEHMLRYTRDEVLPRIDGALEDLRRERREAALRVSSSAPASRRCAAGPA